MRLTRGVWNFHGVDREFKLDGTWLSDDGNPNIGHWEIKNGVLTIVADQIGWTIKFPLPLNPAATPGMDNKGKKQILFQEGQPVQPGQKH